MDKIDFITVLVRILLSVLIGGFLGFERGVRSQAAGLRTHMLVCVGSSLIMMTNIYIADKYGSDPTRLAAQVISGIGFLGAGTILVTERKQVKGLTTAAGLWAAAALGLAVGVGFYEGAIIGTMSILGVLTLFHPIKDLIRKVNLTVSYYIVLKSMESLNRLLVYCETHTIKIKQVETGLASYGNHSEADGDVICYLSIKMRKPSMQLSILEELSSIPGVKYIEEV